MHGPRIFQLLAVLSFFLAGGTASPIAWPEEKLEAINALRAEGASEDEIAARFPRPLIVPGRVPLKHIPQYPTTQSKDTMWLAINLDAEKGSSVSSKQRKLKETIGRRDQDLRKRA